MTQVDDVEDDLALLWGRSIPPDIEPPDLYLALAKLMTGIFLKTSFEATHLDAYDAFCAEVRRHLESEIDAGEAWDGGA